MVRSHCILSWQSDWLGVARSGSVFAQPSPRMVPFYLLTLLLVVSVSFNGAQLSEAATGRPFQRCPYCDSSVFDYCSDKLLHDACCCLDPFEHQLPQECKLADCSFLHANTCRDHHLITRCCCNKIFKI